MNLSNDDPIFDLPPFRTLSKSQLDDVLSDARIVELPEGKVAFTEGARASAFFLLLSGRVKVVQVTPEGQRIVAHFVVPGQFFGLAVAFGRSRYPGTATAVAKGAALSWPAPAWARLAAAYPRLAAAALTSVGFYLQETLDRLRQLASARVEQRIAHALLRLLHQSEHTSKAEVEIAFPITRQDVAEMASTTLHTASRTLHAWEKAGVLSGGRRRIVVRDVPALMRIAGQV